jgi:hypothetical protein
MLATEGAVPTDGIDATEPIDADGSSEPILGNAFSTCGSVLRTGLGSSDLGTGHALLQSVVARFEIAALDADPSECSPAVKSTDFGAGHSLLQRVIAHHVQTTRCNSST